MQGRLRVDAAGRHLDGSPGVVHVFPAGCRHDQGAAGAWHTICLLLRGEDPLWADGPRAIATGGDGLLRAWFDQACTLAASRAAEDRAAADALAAAVAARLRRAQRAEHEAGSLPPAVHAALARIETALDRDLDVAALARAVGLSRSRLGELFRRHLGCPPLRHHARLRMERARTRLANPYTSVTAVARDLGFADLNWFVRRFRAVHGAPPGRLRRGE